MASDDIENLGLNIESPSWSTTRSELKSFCILNCLQIELGKSGINGSHEVNNFKFQVLPQPCFIQSSYRGCAELICAEQASAQPAR